MIKTNPLKVTKSKDCQTQPIGGNPLHAHQQGIIQTPVWPDDRPLLGLIALFFPFSYFDEEQKQQSEHQPFDLTSIYSPGKAAPNTAPPGLPSFSILNHFFNTG